jgi:hypothetical protein
MSDHLHEPKNAQHYDESKIGLKTGPADKPTWKGRMGTTQTENASMMPLSRTPNPVAQFGASAGRHGTEQVTSTKMPLSRTTTSPYDNTSKTTPEESYKKKG